MRKSKTSSSAERFAVRREPLDNHETGRKAARRRALDGHGHKRRRRLETNAHEDDLPFGMSLGEGERIEGRVDDLDRAARGLFRKQA